MFLFSHSFIIFPAQGHRRTWVYHIMHWLKGHHHKINNCKLSNKCSWMKPCRLTHSAAPSSLSGLGYFTSQSTWTGSQRECWWTKERPERGMLWFHLNLVKYFSQLGVSKYFKSLLQLISSLDRVDMTCGLKSVFCILDNLRVFNSPWYSL